MKLNYYILWVEDNDSWFKDTSELFEMTINDYGFQAIIDRKTTLKAVEEEIAKNNLKKYDILLIDFNLKDSPNGDSIIELLRGKEIYTDIVFYSSDKGLIIDAINKHHFEGVYHSDRNELEDKFEKVFKTTIKKIEEINSMRGLIVGETSELDSIIDELLLFYTQSPFIENFDCDKYIQEQVFAKLEGKLTFLQKCYDEQGLSGLLPRFEAIRKWELLRNILKKNKDSKEYISVFLSINATYQDDVIDIRNKFAHAKVIIQEDGTEVLEAQFKGSHFEFNETKFKEIRESLLKHREALIKLRD